MNVNWLRRARVPPALCQPLLATLPRPHPLIKPDTWRVYAGAVFARRMTSGGSSICCVTPVSRAARLLARRFAPRIIGSAHHTSPTLNIMLSPLSGGSLEPVMDMGFGRAFVPHASALSPVGRMRDRILYFRPS